MGIFLFVAGMAVFAAEGGTVSKSVQVRLWLKIADGGSTRHRVEALRKLGTLADRQLLESLRVVERLEKIARDDGDHPRARKVAVDALVHLTTDINPVLKHKTKDVLLKLVKNSQEHIVIRQRCADGLGKIVKKGAVEDRSAIAALAKIAENTREQSRLRATCIDAIAEIGAEKYIDLIRKLLSDKDPLVRQSAAGALETLVVGTGSTPTGMAEVLWKIVLNREVEIPERIKMLKTIRSMAGRGIKSKTAGPKIVKLLKSEKDERLLLVAVGVASMYAEPDAVQPIEDFYKKLSGAEKSSQRAEVCYLLGDMVEQFGKRVDFRTVSRAAKRVVGLLIDALKNDDSPEVAKAASFALGDLHKKKFDRREAVKELIDTVEHDPEEAVREAAIESLSMITGRNFGKDAAKWRLWYGKNVKSLGPRGR